MEPFMSKSDSVTEINPISPSGEALPDELVAITLRNQKESPLLRLPTEIRLMIWEFAAERYLIKPCTIKGKIMFQINLVENGKIPTIRMFHPFITLHSLLQLPPTIPIAICRQIESEAAHDPIAKFKDNIFQIYDGDSFTTWLHTLSIRERLAIETILIFINPFTVPPNNTIAPERSLHDLKNLKHIIYESNVPRLEKIQALAKSRGIRREQLFWDWKLEIQALTKL